MMNRAVALVCLAALVGCSGPESRGDDLLRQGQYEEALGQYETVIKKDPRSAELHYKVGLSHLKLRHLSRALSHLEQAVKLGSQEKGRLGLAEVLTLMGAYDKAVKNYLDVLGHTSEAATVYNNLGVLYIRLRQYVPAEKALEKAQSQRPDAAVVYLNRAVALDRMLDKPGQAYGNYSCFARLNPDEAQSINVSSRMEYLTTKHSFSPAEAERSVGCPPKVQQKKPRPDRLPTWFRADILPRTRVVPTGNLALEPAEALYLQQRYADAARALRQLEALGRLDGKGYFLMGMCYLKAKDPFQAIPRLQKAVELMQTEADPVYELGWAYEMSGDRDSALQTWRKGASAFRSDPRFGHVLKGR